MNAAQLVSAMRGYMFLHGWEEKAKHCYFFMQIPIDHYILVKIMLLNIYIYLSVKTGTFSAGCNNYKCTGTSRIYMHAYSSLLFRIYWSFVIAKLGKNLVSELFSVGFCIFLK